MCNGVNHFKRGWDGLAKSQQEFLWELISDTLPWDIVFLTRKMKYNIK